MVDMNEANGTSGRRSATEKSGSHASVGRIYRTDRDRPLIKRRLCVVVYDVGGSNAGSLLADKVTE